MKKQFVNLHHVNATPEDLAGNNGLGRYILLPGSDGRAKEIAQHFNQMTVKSHPRGHHLYIGTLTAGTKTIDVGAVATGMGCPSMEIVLHELFHLGVKRFLRVGTTGSLQPNIVKLGHLVNVTGSVRDESTTGDYVPAGFPAMSSSEMVTAISRAAHTLTFEDKLHVGIVHCKSSLYAREFSAGPKHVENDRYLQLLADCGVLTSEMETAALFVQSHLYDYQLRLTGKGPQHRVISGAILGVLGVLPNQFVNAEDEKILNDRMIALSLESLREMYTVDNF